MGLTLWFWLQARRPWYSRHRLQIGQLARTKSIPFSIVAESFLATHFEAVCLATMLLVAFLVRAAGLTSIEPNVLASEAEQLRLLFLGQAGYGAGLIGVTPAGEPAASLAPAAILGRFMGASVVTLRLSTALGSLLALLAFFRLARTSLDLFASLAATGLLAMSAWFLYFSRNGELAIWTLVLTLGALYFTRAALASGQSQDWRYAGLCCGLGIYSERGGLLILPLTLLFLIGSALTGNVSRQRAVVGGGLLVFLTLLLALPQLPVLASSWGAVTAALAEGPMLQAPRDANLLSTYLQHLTQTIRSFLLLDPTLAGVARNHPIGSPILDSLTGTLFLVGLILSFKQAKPRLAWYLLLGTALLVVEPFGRLVPDGSRALLALPAMAYFAGHSIEWLTQRRQIGDLARLACLLVVPATCIWNWNQYVEWQRLPANVAARQPALATVDVRDWQELQLAQAEQGNQALSLDDWLQVRDQLRPAGTISNRVASAIETRPLESFGPGSGLTRPRGVAGQEDNSTYVLEQDGRVLRLDSTGKQIATLGRTTGGPATEEVSDLARGQDGRLYVLDAGRARIDRYGPDGRFADSLGADWGMYKPRGMSIGLDGKIYVADTGRNRVVVAVEDKVEKSFGDLDPPTDVVADQRGWLYVAEPESARLSVLDQDGRSQGTWRLGRANTVDGPHLAYLEGSIVAVIDQDKRRVVFLDLSGRELGEIGGEGSQTFGLPYAIGAFGNRLLVTDLGKPAVLSFEITTR